MYVSTWYVFYCVVMCDMLFVMCDLLVLLWFFFFKQKTAYEMRISDWSSDVCSSDLYFAGQSVFTAGHPYSGTSRSRAGTARRRYPGTGQIGRASCRERVCQYV